MEQYWNQRPQAPFPHPPTPKSSSSHSGDEDEDDPKSTFDRYRKELVRSSEQEEESWRSELRRYLSHYPKVKRSMDLVKYWQVRNMQSR
jgi:hypothetical protein